MTNFFQAVLVVVVAVIIAVIYIEDRSITTVSETQTLEQRANQVAICCLYYHVCAQDPEFGQWTNEARSLFENWIKNDFDAPVECLPKNVRKWVVKIKEG